MFQADKDEPVTSIPFPTESPAVRARVYIPLTSILVLLYSTIFILTYIQLIQIRYYKHKRFSYQTSLLFLILVWSALRIFLFSFYFQNVEQANTFDFAVYFCLYCLPAVLQFGTFCVLVLYYGQVFNKAIYRQNRRYYNIVLRVVVAVGMVVFFVTSFVVAYLTRMCRYKSNTELLTQLSLIRVYTNDSLFVLFGLILSVYLFKLVKISKKQYLPEKSRVSVSKALVITIFTTFFLITRGVYNVLALNAVRLNLPDFNFGWINVSDQADLVSLTETNKFVSFFCVLAIWELIPTFVIICIFRLAKTDRVSTTVMNFASATESFAGKSVFFDSKVSAEFATDSIEYYSKQDQAAATPILSESFTSDNNTAINEIRYYQSLDET